MSDSETNIYFILWIGKQAKIESMSRERKKKLTAKLLVLTPSNTIHT